MLDENNNNNDYGMTSSVASAVTIEPSKFSNQDHITMMKVSDMIIQKTRNPLLIGSRKAIVNKSNLRLNKKKGNDGVNKSTESDASPPKTVYNIRVHQP